MRTVSTLYLMLLVLNGYSQQVSRVTAAQQTDNSSYSNAKLSGLECNIVSGFSTDPDACVGLDNEGSYLWASFTSSYEYIFKLDTFGNRVDSINLPFLASGTNYDDMEVSGSTLWTVPEGPAKLFVINLNIKSVTEIALPAFGFEPYHYFSVAFDGQFLWVLNYQTPTFETRLYKMDTATYAVLDSVDLVHPVVTIEMIGNELWGYCVAQCFPFQMFRINTSTGAFIDSSEWCVTGSPYGMAWDGSSLWQTAAFDRMIHKIDVGLNIGISPATSASNPVLVAFPNPAATRVEISSGGMKGTLMIRNNSGAAVYRSVTDGKNISLPLDHYPSGMYLAHLYDEDGRVVSARFAVMR